MKQLVDCLQAVITPNRTIWNSIFIVVELDSLHKEFQPIIASLLYAEDKKLKEIQQIVTSTEVGLIAKRATGILAGDIAMSFKFKFDPNPNKTETIMSIFTVIRKDTM